MSTNSIITTSIKGIEMKKVIIEYKMLLPAFLFIICAFMFFAREPGTSSTITASMQLPAAAQTAAAPVSKINSGDTAWVMVATAMVMLMTVPGLAFFYCGLVRRKNVLSILMQCFAILCILSLHWVIIGYSLAFGPDLCGKGLIGGLEWAFLEGVGLEPHNFYATTIPHQVFMMFQAMFAVITPALIIGAFAERIKFSSLCVFTLLWATCVYDPLAHWVWADGGFLGTSGGMGVLDFAGGTVIEINSGMASLAAALIVGKRKGYPDKISPPHNLPFAVLGAGLLWFGWFGFNAGSALAANSVAANAFVTTHIAGATAAIVWGIMDCIYNKRPTVLGIITGAVAGLVAITPACGFVNLRGAIGVGIGAGVLCYPVVAFIKPRFNYDDSLDVFGVHGIGGIWGIIATGLYATTTVNSSAANGLFYGNPAQLLIQCKAAAITIVFSFVASYILLKVVDLVMGLRVTDHEERVGLDLSEHREAAYTLID
jgi:Amt family ammonium transporter